ncbi:hypothetical protein NBRC110019_25870 [Neptunitalea chrysea]|uniref:Histidyl-tRNA synthetase n=1 Tax=Neptunitalea chrysea TaxID=1647581 RepID=A0A9W6B6Q5_9FLAO|nr:DUF6495 family protein [Neptunitalea chrysea]GLB53546.1 hypothetical protein NBRC110019_25870 [Neptunitalea chrysea]
MKYSRLTKEQLEEMHEEFSRFLATQQITADEWNKIKIESPDVAEQEIDIFSDLVWEKVLENVVYADKVDQQNIFLFYFGEKDMKLIAFKVSNVAIDLTTNKGMEWLIANCKEDTVRVFKANKAYSVDKKMDIFTLIQQGAVISKGELYNHFSTVIG